ncbi:hypothetical protein [Egbenema bharatensis]|uniref:hypothetical protein n=1 Tax=Egbenema bharatensis TaxID=3463334 RepID=UPI003A8B8563
MRAKSCAISSCRHCLFYESMGRRGGQCRQLGVPVQSYWKTCSLAVPPFIPAWERLEPLVALSQVAIEEVQAIVPATDPPIYAVVHAADPQVVTTP